MPLPTPLRAALGLIATAVDEARTLPDKAIELPMLAVSTALQMSLRAQQRYGRLAARGDELLNRRESTDEPPEWATFDAPIAAEQPGLVAAEQLGLVDAEQLGLVDRDQVGLADREQVGPAGEEPRPPGKTVRKPRNTRPSAFDTIGDE